MRKILLAIATIILVALFFIYTSPSDFRSQSKIPFSSEQWKEGDLIMRASMADNLMTSDTLINLTRQEALELLGEPDINFEQSFLYRLDFGHIWWPGVVWPYEFRVHFDSTDKVIRAGYSD